MDEVAYQMNLLKAMNQQLKQENNMYARLVETSNNAFLYYSFQDKHFRTMGNWEHFFDVPVNSKKELSRVFDTVREEYVQPLKEAIGLENKGLTYTSQEFCKKDGSLWGECEVTMSYHQDGSPAEETIRFRDITKFKAQNDNLTYMAYYDMLTGLYNRNYFVQELTKWLQRAEKENMIVSVVFIDINDFKKINDGMGILVGDELIQVFGQYLSEFAEDENIICAHFNADVYCMAVYDPFGKRNVGYLYQTIHERIKKPFMLSTGPISIDVNVGVAEYPEASTSALELINYAEIIMFRSKKDSTSNIRYFDAPLIKEFRENAAIEHKLKHAVPEKEFVLYYQPQYEAETGRLRGVEALIRWVNEDGTVISPSQFIPIAEKNHTIISIGEWVLEKAVSTIAKWKQEYGAPIIMSINVSAVQYRQEGFVHQLMKLLRKYQVDPSEIELEITETVLIEDFDLILQKMKYLKRHGIKIAIDDFGTGYSSLSYLKGLPVHTVKIDKSFVDTVVQDKASRILVEAIIQMVSRLGYHTIAEGVEQKEQYDYLKQIGCEYIQGFLLGEPFSEQQMTTLLKEQTVFA